MDSTIKINRNFSLLDFRKSFLPSIPTIDIEFMQLLMSLISNGKNEEFIISSLYEEICKYVIADENIFQYYLLVLVKFGYIKLVNDHKL